MVVVHQAVGGLVIMAVFHGFLASRSASGINKLSPIIEIVVLLGTMVVCDVPHEAPWTTLVQWRFGAEMNCRPIDPPTRRLIMQH